jgi:uncharacterized repeat protein (TIGR04076 family)
MLNLGELMAESTNKPRVGYQGPGHYRVKIEVISQTGQCGNGHKVGDSWIAEHVTPGGICIAAFNAMCPQLEMLEFGGCFPWKPDKDELQLACPDSKNPVIFQLRRIRE